jgi:uncharacterized protein
MMFISIRDLASRGKSVHFSETLNVTELLRSHTDVVKHGLLAMELDAQAESGMTVVKGNLTLPVEMVCSRCLTTTEQTLHIPFYEEFTQKSELMPKDEPEAIHLVSEDKIELNPYVEETVSLALPYIPLCSPTCKGICPECGKNRNEQSCDCKQEKLDPRLAGLADFFNK